MLVTDASAGLGLVFSDEDETYARCVARSVRQGGAAVPGIFWWEIRHVLVIGERRGRQPEIETVRFLQNLQVVGVQVAGVPTGPGDVVTLARRHHLSVYDAAYLDLAQRSGSALASLDKRLNRAAEAEGVPRFSAGG